MREDIQRDPLSGSVSQGKACAGRDLRLQLVATGFTLTELLVTVAILSLLAAIGYPSYLEHARKTKRGVAKGALIELAARQTQYYLDNKTYTADLTNLGYPISPAFIDSSGTAVAATDTDRIYQIGAVAGSVSATGFTVEAVPQLGQTKDTVCATLRLSNVGQKTETGTGAASDCW